MGRFESKAHRRGACQCQTTFGSGLLENSVGLCYHAVGTMRGRENHGAVGLAPTHAFLTCCIEFRRDSCHIRGCGRGILRRKNASMKNYDVEMWRYSRELKLAMGSR